jgi:glycosyltransferase involved in cell wall biosynthesis
VIEDSGMKILFIARTYAPFVGGMEKFANDFYTNLQEFSDIKLLANHHGKRKIIHFFFKALVYLIFNASSFEIIHFNDAVLAPLIWVVKTFSNAKVTFTVHGLDIVYTKFGYQRLIVPFLRKADKIFPVSEYTKRQCLERGISEDKLFVIPNGLVFSEIKKCSTLGKQSLSFKYYGHNEGNQTILLSLGRLIKRKGHTWFIENVFVKLPDSFIYLIAGNGREFDNIAETIRRHKLDKRVRLLGFVSEQEKACLFEMADLFIMPNISDQNDQEGFGIVLLEAGSYSLPTVASKIEGITDAIIDGVTGILINEKDTEGFVNAILNSEINASIIPDELYAKYNWQKIGQTYYQEFREILR